MNTHHKPRMPTDIDAAIGAKLCTLRQARNISQTDVGNAIGVSFQQIQKYEKGKNRLSASRLWKICDYFGVMPNDFYYGTNAGAIDYDCCKDNNTPN